MSRPLTTSVQTGTGANDRMPGNAFLREIARHRQRTLRDNYPRVCEKIH